MLYKSELMGKITTILSYVAGASLLLFDGTVDYLDHHAGAIGSGTAIATLAINWYYARKK